MGQMQRWSSVLVKQRKPIVVVRFAWILQDERHLFKKEICSGLRESTLRNHLLPSALTWFVIFFPSLTDAHSERLWCGGAEATPADRSPLNDSQCWQMLDVPSDIALRLMLLPHERLYLCASIEGKCPSHGRLPLWGKQRAATRDAEWEIWNAGR